MKNKYITLFTSTFKLSASTFGGGFVIIPLMRKKFVEELGWISEEEMLDLVAIAQSSPGAIAVNASILVGYRVAKIKGSIISVIGTILPPLIIISIISLFYKQFRDNFIINLMMKGMLCGVAATILDVVFNMAKTIFTQKRLLPVLMMILAFIANYYLAINIIIIIIISALIGSLDTLYQEKKGTKII